MFRLTTLLALAPLLACNEYNLDQAEDAEGSRILIEVSPASIDFGDLVRDEVETRRFTIANVSEGESDLTIDSISLGAGSDGFSVLTPTPTEMLPPGAEVEIEVSFTPYGGDDQEGLVVILSNADDEPEAWVNLNGRGLVPELEISPESYDFGDMYLGCEAELGLQLTNIGNDVLVIDDLRANGDWMEYSHNMVFPVELEPGDSRPMDVYYAPETTGEGFLGSVTVWSNEPIGERTATQSGAAHLVGEQIDEFHIDEEPPTDIMWVVDQSGSMDSDHTRLQSNFAYFITNLESYTDNWQLIVANDDGGCLNTGGILTPSVPNYENYFNNAVSSGNDPNVNLVEALVKTAYHGVYNTDMGECNSGFMREDAVLHVIVVSDEPEQSGNTELYAQGIMDKKFLQSGSYDMVRISAIVGDVPNGCGDAEPGHGYWEATQMSGGLFLSICENDWAPYMDQIAAASVIETSFPLSYTPWEPTIQVFLNDVLVEGEHWDYVSATNSIEFTGTFVRPGSGDTVRVIYGEYADCDG